MPTDQIPSKHLTSPIDVSPFTVTPIGIIHSCFKEKFATPRQTGPVTAALAQIKLHAPYNQADTVTGLEEFSHIWLSFIFHHTAGQRLEAKSTTTKAWR